MKLTLKQMHYFDALARALHFGRAAASVNITQPAMSAQIMDMEARLGRKLVERRHGRVVLTEAGQRILPHIRRILRDVQSLEEMLSQDRGLLVGSLRIGMIPTIAPYLLPQLIPHLQAHYPKLELKVRETVTDTLVRELAEELGVDSVLKIENGTMVRLAPGHPGKVDDIAVGRLYRDGRLIGNLESMGIVERRRLAFAGHIGVSVVLDAKGALLADPEVRLMGLPLEDASGRPLEESVFNAALGAIDSIPRPRRRDPELVREAVRRAVRAEIAAAWGKKPNCSVFLTVV